MEEHEQEVDPKDVVIRRLQGTILLMAGPHCSDDHPLEETCIYCGTDWPCHTVRLARRSATVWDGLG